MGNIKNNILADVNPTLAAQWHPTKNGTLRPADVTAGSGMKVWWQCEHGHEWEASIKNRHCNSTGCPGCCQRGAAKEGKDIATTHPAIAAQWHPTKNGDLTPRQVSQGSQKKVWWQCECGREWQATINDRTDGHGCPECYRRQFAIPGKTDLATINPVLAAEWHPTENDDLNPTEVTAGSHKKVWWLCPNCGYAWQAVISSRHYNQAGCPVCSRERRHNS